MRIQIGEIEALYRYPVKSMAGERLSEAELGWHGVDGDRRLALRRIEERGGFPWLTATKLPELLLYEPLRLEPATGGLPSHLRTPEGRELPLFGPELADDIVHRHGAPLEMMYLDRGIFDEASLSVIATATVAEICRWVELPPDVRRFRPNLLLRTHQAQPFEEDEWVGGVLTFGEGPDAPALTITNRDERCSMVCFDPDTAQVTPEVMKRIVQRRDNRAGVYASVTRRGRVVVGQAVYFERAVGLAEPARAQKHP